MLQCSNWVRFANSPTLTVSLSLNLMNYSRMKYGEQQPTPEAPKAPEQGALPECPLHPRGVKPCR